MSAQRKFPQFLLLVCVLTIMVIAGMSRAEDSTRKVVSRSAPSYPELAKKMHLSGKVKVEVEVNPAGTVTAAKMVGGNPVFETAAVQAVKQWKFETAPTSTKGVITLEFADQ